MYTPFPDKNGKPLPERNGSKTLYMSDPVLPPATQTPDTSAEAIQRDADYLANWAKDVRENNGSVADAENMEAMNARLLALVAERDALKAELKVIHEMTGQQRDRLPSAAQNNGGDG